MLPKFLLAYDTYFGILKEVANGFCDRLFKYLFDFLTLNIYKIIIKIH